MVRNWFWKPGTAILTPLVLVLLIAVACGGAAPATPVPPTKSTAAAAAPVAGPTATPAAIAKPAPTLAPPAAQPRRGGTLKFVPQASIKSLDPMWTTAYVTAKNFANYVYEGLFAMDAEWMSQPMLVETWKVSEDGLKLSFTLRSGLTFHNGEPVTTKDALGSFKRAAGREPAGKLLMSTFIDKIEEVDKLTFTMTMKEPTGILLPTIAAPVAFRFVVMPESIWKVSAAEGAKEAIGTGPFKFASWTPGDRYVLERWDGYKSRTEPSSMMAGRKTVHIDRLEAIEIPDHATRVAALETGEVDFLDEFKSDFVKRVKANPNLNLYIMDPGSTLVLVLNHSRPPFNDVRARKAVQLAYPVEKALQAVGGDPDMWKPCGSLWSCKSAFGKAGTRGAQGVYNVRDVAKAKQLVRDAGLVGAKVRLMSPEDTQVGPAALITQEVLKELGFQVDFQATDWGTVVTRRAEPELWEAFHTWGGFDFNGLSPMRNLLIYKDGWFNKYQDPSGRATKALEAFARASTLPEQEKLSGDLAEPFWEEVPYVSVGEFFQVMASRKELKNYKPYTIPLFWDVWFEK